VYGAPIPPRWLDFGLVICICLAVAAPGVYVFFYGGINSFTPTWLQIAVALLQLVSVAAGVAVLLILLVLLFTVSEYRNAWRSYFRYRDQRGLALARRLLELNPEAAEQDLTTAEKARLIRARVGARTGEKVFFYLTPEAIVSSYPDADGVIFCSHYLYNPLAAFPEARKERREGFQIGIFSLSKLHEVSSQAILDHVISKPRWLLCEWSPDRARVGDSTTPTSVYREDMAKKFFLSSLESLSYSAYRAQETLSRLVRLVTQGKQAWLDVPSWEREDFAVLKRQWKKRR